MKMTVDPTQIRDEYTNAYMNMMNTNGGGICVWTSLFAQPTYLLKQDARIYFATFSSQVWAEEWLEEYGESYEVLWSFEPEESE